MRVGITEAEQEIVDGIGEDAAKLMIKQFGGTRCYVPLSVPDDHFLCEAVGREVVEKLVAWAGGGAVNIPKRATQAVYNDVVQARREGKLTTAQIAVGNNLSERHVYRILAEAKANGDL